MSDFLQLPKILVGTSSALGVLRLNVDGTIDVLFGEDGIAKTLLGNELPTVKTVAVQKSGKILVAGRTLTYAEVHGGFRVSFGLVRYNLDGTLDTSFGEIGKVITKVDPSGIAKVIAFQSDGKIVAAGYKSSLRRSYSEPFTPPQMIQLARYLP